MAYGSVKVDTIIFDNGGSDQSATVSGFYRATTSGVTVSGTLGAAIISGVTVVGSTTVSGVTVIGSTTVSGATVTGTVIKGTTVEGVSGTFTSLTGTTGTFASLTGTITTGTTANFVSGVFTTQVSGTTVTGTTSSFTSGNFTVLSVATATFTSGVIASGTVTNPSLSFEGDPNTGIYSPGADQLALVTNGVERVEFGTVEVVFNDGGADVDFRVEGDTKINLFKVDAGIDTVIIDGTQQLSNQTPLRFGDINDSNYVGLRSPATVTTSVTWDLPAADGLPDQLLKTNGSGVLDWITIPSSFPVGTVMLFQQTSAPAGWTKITTHDNKALRVVSGTVGTGGSSTFSSVFASRTPTGSVSGTNSSGIVGATTLTTAQIPSHTHTILVPAFSTAFAGGGQFVPNTSGNTGATGGGASHTHGFTEPSWSGSFSGSAMDFAVAYVDIIFASKD